MRRIVFYTWQSDLPNSTNRSFIQQALENVAKTITADDTVDVEPVIDRDTQGVAGAPDIAKTIFQKIAEADVVVADVSIINGQRRGRPAPNPNVLIELGYALKALGDGRVVLVFNTAFGKLEQLPFDLKMRRAVAYSMPESATDRATERKALESKLDAAIRTALGSIKPEAPRPFTSDAIEAIERSAPNRIILVRGVLAELLKRLEEKRPKSLGAGDWAKDIEEALRRTEDIVLDYGRVAATAAAVGDEESARELYRGFGSILDQYYVPPGFSGTIFRPDFDFIKFHGHELFTTFITCLVREERWELISRLLAEGIPVKYQRQANGPGFQSFLEISKPVEFAVVLNQERKRISVRADILKSRHDSERSLGQIMPFDDFVAADFLLFLRSKGWRPWSALYLTAVPRFVRAAESSGVAQRIAGAIAVPDLEAFRQRLGESALALEQMFQNGWWDQPFGQADIGLVGSRA
jgi:hypothetical protein